MERIVGKPLVSQAAIAKRVRELGNTITQEYANKDLLVVGILRGAFVFFADLTRAINLPLTLDFMTVQSRGGAATAQERVSIIADLTEEISQREVLLVEDIVDSGLTISYLQQVLQARHPRSLKICTLLDKPSRRRVEVAVAYVGFTIPNQYVVGYGLDYHNQYRNLPYIATLPAVEWT